MPKPAVLVVDDEPDLCELLSITLERMDLSPRTADSVAAAQRMLKTERFDLCLTDMQLPDGDGFDLVKWMQQYSPSVPVAVITAHGNMETAVRALKVGAFDFVSKPLDLAGLRKLVATAIKLSDTNDGDTSVFGPRLLGTSAAMQHLREMIARVARSQAPVHIFGESGTGKELVAKLIHESGPRRDGPFVPVNCGAIPTELMESELFGHKRGSFTGAVSDKKGLIQSAEGGTLFLDEIADLPLHMQVKLLRVIQEKAVRPVGEQLEVGIDVRDSLGYAQESRPAGGRRQISRGPVLPGQRHRIARALAARTAGGCPGARRGHPAQARAAHENHAADAREGRVGRARGLRFSGQRPRAREHPGARDHLDHQRRGTRQRHSAEAHARRRRSWAPAPRRRERWATTWKTSNATPSSRRSSRHASTRRPPPRYWGCAFARCDTGSRSSGSSSCAAKNVIALTNFWSFIMFK